MCDDVTALAAGLALDAVEDADRARVEEHVAECPRCAAALQEFRDVAFALGSAFAAARDRVLASGQSVLQSEGGFIYRVFPDGRKELVKQIDPPVGIW